MSATCNLRLVPRLDIKGPNLIKGVHLEGLRVIGSPQKFAFLYYQQGADELIYMDSVASLYGRNHLSNIIKEAAKNIFIPITVGGGIRSVEDASQILRSGADKIALNTAAVNKPLLINDLARQFGKQCVVLSLEAKKVKEGVWEVFTDNGREKTGKNAIDWVREATEYGAGEVLVTSIDREGTREGFDLDLIRSVTDAVSVPVIASGGMGRPADAISAVNEGGADAIAMADILHYGRATIRDIREICLSAGLRVRNYA